MNDLEEPQSPMKLENLLQVPLQIIKLEDLLREKSSSIQPTHPPKDSNNKDVDNRQCRSADSQLSSGRNKLDESRLLQRSLSTSCLFDCCAQPSRWKDTEIFSNFAKFKTTAITLPDRTSVVIPIMDFGGGALTSKEKHNTSEDVDVNVDEGAFQKSSQHVDVVGGGSVTSQGFEKLPEPKPLTGVVLGTVTENPTRYKDLVLEQASRVVSSTVIKNLNSDSLDGTRSQNRNEDVDEGDDDGKSKALKSDDLDMLKLTFYNDGRKEHVKEFRTSEDAPLFTSKGTEEVDVRYYENSHGLQMSRVPREKASVGNNTTVAHDNTHSQFQITRTNTDFIQDRTLPISIIVNPSKSRINLNMNMNSESDKSKDNINSKEDTMDKCEGLQISRCQSQNQNQSDISNKVASYLGREIDMRARQRLSYLMASENEKGEAETLIERHLQNYLTSLRYVKPNNGGGENNMGSPGRSGEDFNRSSRKSSLASSPEIVSKSIASNNVNSGNVGNSGNPGNTVISLPKRSLGSPTVAQKRSPASNSIQLEGRERIITRTIPPQYSPSQQQCTRQSQPLPPSTSSSVETWSDKLIPRIQTRPYLRNNVTYEQQGYHQPGIGMDLQGFHSSPKRFKGSNPNLKRPTQIQGFTHSTGSAMLNNEMNNMSYHQQRPSNMASTQPSYSSTSYNSANLQQGQQQQQQQSYYHHPQHPHHHQQQQSSNGSHASNNIRLPHNSPITRPQPQHSQQQTQPQLNYSQNQRNNTNPSEQQLKESIMITNAASQRSFDNNSYYDRLKRYWEYYQKQELDWTKLSDYYRAQTQTQPHHHQVAREWSSQQQQQQNHHHQLRIQQSQSYSPSSSRRHQGEMESMAQHQLALRAMDAVIAEGNERMNLNKITPSSYLTYSQQQHERLIQNQKALTPPQASPPNPAIQSKYDYNTQQLQKLQQIQQRINYQQQQQRNYQIHNSSNFQIKNHDQIQVEAAPRIQKSIPYRNSYDQHGVGARGNGGSSAIENQLRSNLGSTSMSAGEYDQRHPSPQVIQKAPGPSASEDISFATSSNIHRQALEMAIKNNFRAGNNENVNAPNNYKGAKKFVGASTSPSAGQRNQLYQSQNSSGWSNSNNQNGILSRVNATAPLPNSPQKSPVNARLTQQVSSVQSANIVIRKNATFSPDDTHCSESQYYQEASRKLNWNNQAPIAIAHRQRYQYPPVTETCRPTSGTKRSFAEIEYSVSDKSKQRMEGNNQCFLKDNVNFGRNHSHNQVAKCASMRATSPVPLIVEEEEIMIASVSPSTVLAVNAVDEEATMDANEPNEEDRGDSNGICQYDHVVLLDKRIKTYMCKRCFETLKTEQQIRNHLFCKMLANHVQCHVCLQLVSSDSYPSHLQIHGVRPPDGQIEEEMS